MRNNMGLDWVVKSSGEIVIIRVRINEKWKMYRGKVHWLWYKGYIVYKVGDLFRSIKFRCTVIQRVIWRGRSGNAVEIMAVNVGRNKYFNQ